MAFVTQQLSSTTSNAMSAGSRLLFECVWRLATSTLTIVERRTTQENEKMRAHHEILFVSSYFVVIL